VVDPVMYSYLSIAESFKILWYPSVAVS